MSRPFEFVTTLPLVALTGRSAATVTDLRDRLREATDAMIRYQTYHYYRERPSPRFASRVAYWVSEVLGERVLGERLGTVDLRTTGGAVELRRRLVTLIEAYLDEGPDPREAPSGLELPFCEGRSHLAPSGRIAHTLAEVQAGIEALGVDAVVTHLIDARWPTPAPDRDLIHWLDECGHTMVAERLRSLHPFVYTPDEFHDRVVGILHREHLMARIGRRIARYPVETPVTHLIERLPFIHDAREVMHDLFRTRRQDDRRPR